jgi:hypothetical protein
MFSPQEQLHRSLLSTPVVKDPLEERLEKLSKDELMELLRLESTGNTELSAVGVEKTASAEDAAELFRFAAASGKTMAEKTAGLSHDAQMLVGMGGAAALGAGIGHGVGRKQGVQQERKFAPLRNAITHQMAVDQVATHLRQAGHTVKTSAPVGSVGKLIGKGALQVMKAPTAARIAAGAGVGAVAGAVTGHGDRINPATGAPESGNRLGRALMGGAAGAAAGHFAPRALQAVGGTNTTAGKFLQRGVRASAAEAGDATGMSMARSMQQNRVAGRLGDRAAQRSMVPAGGQGPSSKLVQPPPGTVPSYKGGPTRW